MRWSAVLLLVAVHTWAAEDVRLSREERRVEAEWLSSLGLKVREGGPLLERPFDPPFTNRSLLVPTAWWREAPLREIAPDALRMDLPLLHTVMQKAYGGWSSAEKRGWNWDSWFADWDRDLAAKGSAKVSMREALAAVVKLMDFQLDNHTGPAGAAGFGSGSRTAVLESTPGGTCTEMETAEGKRFDLDPKDPAQVPKTAHLGDSQVYYFTYPARRGTATAIRCGVLWNPVHVTWQNSKRQQLVADLAERPGSEPSYRKVSDTIGYLRLPTFTKQNGELLRQLLPTLPASAGHEKLLIVDLRGNGGGDAPLGSLARWLDPVALRPAIRFNRRQPKSCLYDALSWGYTQVTSQKLQPPISDQLRRNMQKQLDDLFAPSPEGCPVRIEEEHSTWNYRQHRFPAAPKGSKPRLLVLVDNGCGSDCEYLTYVLAASPGSVIAGENTFGVGQFIQPGYLILPHSRLPFRIAMGMSDDYGDGRSFDGYGLDVDMVLDSEESQGAAAILRLAQTLAVGQIALR